MLRSEDKRQMLTFAPLLFIAVCIVYLDGASHRNGFDGSVQSSSVWRSIGVKEDSPTPEDGDEKTVNEILQHSLVELTETLQRLESNDPFKSMRVPLHVIQMQSPESLVVFQSLLMLLTNPKESGSLMRWQQYLEKSISKHHCSVTDLCREFQPIFKCDEEGRLVFVLLDQKGPFDHLNLRMIPNTVETLSLRRTGLKTISEWIDLKEKSLKKLLVDGNTELKLDLDGLIGDMDYLPLEYLHVSTWSMANYIGNANLRRALRQIGAWMKRSTLNTLRVVHRTHARTLSGVSFHCDGSWTFK